MGSLNNRKQQKLTVSIKDSHVCMVKLKTTLKGPERKTKALVVAQQHLSTGLLKMRKDYVKYLGAVCSESLKLILRFSFPHLTEKNGLNCC